jgi:hypothetical protein
MSKTINQHTAKHFPIKKPISENYYNQRKRDLSEDELNEDYLCEVEHIEFEPDKINYYQIIKSPSTELDLTNLILDKLLDQQKTATKKLRIISGIMVFSLVVSIASFIMAIIASAFIN